MFAKPLCLFRQPVALRGAWLLLLCTALLSQGPIVNAGATCMYNCDPNDPTFNEGHVLDQGNDPDSAHLACKQRAHNACQGGMSGSFSAESFFEQDHNIAQSYVKPATPMIGNDRISVWQNVTLHRFPQHQAEFAAMLRKSFARQKSLMASKGIFVEILDLSDHDLILAYFESHLQSTKQRFGQQNYGDFWSDLWNAIVNFGKAIFQPVQAVCSNIGWRNCWDGVLEMLDLLALDHPHFNASEATVAHIDFRMPDAIPFIATLLASPAPPMSCTSQLCKKCIKCVFEDEFNVFCKEDLWYCNPRMQCPYGDTAIGQHENNNTDYCYGL
jgi:hypothetical protein